MLQNANFHSYISQFGAVQILGHQEKLFKKLGVMKAGSYSVSNVYVKDMNQSHQHLYCVSEV